MINTNICHISEVNIVMAMPDTQRLFWAQIPRFNKRTLGNGIVFPCLYPIAALSLCVRFNS